MLELDIIKKGRDGNRAIINYNNPEGWLLYKTMSDNYPNRIRKIVRKYKNKNDRQQAFKQIMHKLDIECFGIKYKKSKSSARKMGKFKHKEVKELADYVRAHKKKEYKQEKQSTK